MSFAISSHAAKLRERAQARLSSLSAHDDDVARSPLEMQRLVHELQVHQIELEMQNEELQESRAKVEMGLARYVALYDFAPVGYFTLSRGGVILQTNLAGGRLLGLDRADLAGQRFAAFVAQADVPGLSALIEQVFTGQRPLAVEADLVPQNQLQRTVQIEASPSPDGRECCMSVVDITDRKLLEQARYRAASLEVERQAAEAASQAKSAFMSRMSHELRTPLNAILGFTQLMQSDKRHPINELQRHRTDAVLLAGQHLLQLIDDVLDLSQIESGLLRMDIAPIEIQSALDEAMLLVAPVLENSGLTIAVEAVPVSAPHDLVVLADRTRLVQVVVNLLTNAIKYNSASGVIRIIVDSTQPDTKSIAVVDAGRGMTEAQLSCLFEPFNRLGQERSGIPGSGIGLVITKWLVEMMGGKLEVQSTLGQGSRFDVTLRSTYPVPAEHGEPSCRPEVEPFNVLYIEDNSLHAKLMESVVSLHSQCTVHVANSASEGSALAAQLNPQVVMLDLNLPDGRGLAVLHRLRKAQGMQGAKFIVVSADATPNQMDAVLAAGADAYLTKPINVAEVLRMLDQYVLRRRSTLDA